MVGEVDSLVDLVRQLCVGVMAGTQAGARSSCLTLPWQVRPQKQDEGYHVEHMLRHNDTFSLAWLRVA